MCYYCILFSNVQYNFFGLSNIWLLFTLIAKTILLLFALSAIDLFCSVKKFKYCLILFYQEIEILFSFVQRNSEQLSKKMNENKIRCLSEKFEKVRCMDKCREKGDKAFRRWSVCESKSFSESINEDMICCLKWKLEGRQRIWCEFNMFQTYFGVI